MTQNTNRQGLISLSVKVGLLLAAAVTLTYCGVSATTVEQLWDKIINEPATTQSAE